MEKDIFAPKELSQKLREIGFDKPCIAYYGAEINETYPFNVQYKPILISINQPSEKAIPAPTWEQVFKWFREKGYLFVIGYDFSDKKYNYKIVIKKHNEISRITSENYPTYEQARENLALELIKLYKNEKEKI